MERTDILGSDNDGLRISLTKSPGGGPIRQSPVRKWRDISSIFALVLNASVYPSLGRVPLTVI